MSGQAGPVAEAFRERTGRDPDGVWAAPGRVNLIGEHTDYNDGFVLPAAIDLLVLVAAGRRGGGRLRLWSLQTGPPADLDLGEVGPGRVEGWAAYPAGVAWALGQAGVEVGGADLVVDGKVPAGSGLSSSAALECATATALADLHGAGLDRPALAALARRAENEVVGVPSGAMDQMVSMLGRAGHALFLDTRSLATEQVPEDGQGGRVAPPGRFGQPVLAGDQPPRGPDGPRRRDLRHLHRHRVRARRLRPLGQHHHRPPTRQPVPHQLPHRGVQPPLPSLGVP